MVKLTTALVCLLTLASCAAPQNDPRPAPEPVPRIEAPDRDNQQEAHPERDRGALVHEDARDEKPPGLTEAEKDRGELATKQAAREDLKPPAEVGGAQGYSCPSAPVRNFSSRNGARPTEVVLHFTVSPPGTLDAIRRLFNTPSFGASSHYGFELFNGRCQQWVGESKKAWTNGAANPRTVTIEVISNDRTRAQWLSTPALKNGSLAALVRDIAKRYGIPLKLVDPAGCNFVPGITDHARLECGNTHFDMGRGFPWDVFMRQVQAGVPSAPAKVETWCRRLNWFRSEVRKNHTLPAGAGAEAAKRKDLILKAGYVCLKDGPVPR